MSTHGELNFPAVYLFDLILLHRNSKRTYTDQSILQTFLFYLKRNVSQTFKCSSCKKVFLKCVYHWYNLLRWMFFIPCDKWETFFIQIYRNPKVWYNRLVLRSLKQMFLKKPTIYIRYIHNDITVVIPKVQNKTSTC